MKRFRILSLIATALGLGACAAPQQAHFQLVETVPVGTVLGSPDLPETSQVWHAMLAGADESIDLCHFYIVSEKTGLLKGIIAQVEAAAMRGVRVRCLVGEKFYSTYPEMIDRWTDMPEIALRRLDLAESTGGVQHAKYMVVDGHDTYLGSANFDWRALEHIQELGLRINSETFATNLLDVFRHDWALAGGEPQPVPQGEPGLVVSGHLDRGQVRTRFGTGLTLEPAHSPSGLLPHESQWDLPKLQAIIDGAERNLYLQLLTLDLVDPGGNHFEELEDALIRAAARGVKVRILVADWCDREGVIEGLRDLASLPDIGVRMATIPEHSGGHIPFARVIHAKYMVADRGVAWLGTSNWEKGYFFESRNVGVILRGPGVADRLEHFFRTNWSSPYVRDVLPVVEAASEQK